MVEARGENAKVWNTNQRYETKMDAVLHLRQLLFHQRKSTKIYTKFRIGTKAWEWYKILQCLTPFKGDLQPLENEFFIQLQTTAIIHQRQNEIKNVEALFHIQPLKNLLEHIQN